MHYIKLNTLSKVKPDKGEMSMVSVQSSVELAETFDLMQLKNVPDNMRDATHKFLLQDGEMNDYNIRENGN